MNTNFRKVVHFNKQFGVLDSENLVLKPDIIQNNPNTVEFCLKLIREEIKELEQAVVDNNFVEVVDALGDALYVIYGMAARIGVDIDKAFDLIHENNMSKLCQSEEEAIKSVEYYEKNMDTLGYDSPSYRPSDDGNRWVVFNKSTKKVLKSVDYKPVDLTSVCSKQ